MFVLVRQVSGRGGSSGNGTGPLGATAGDPPTERSTERMGSFVRFIRTVLEMLICVQMPCARGTRASFAADRFFRDSD